MANKTMVDGTKYEIKSGRVMVEGTVYDIIKGIALVDGTAYEIKFGTDQTVIVTGTADNGSTNYGYAMVLGEKLKPEFEQSYATDGELEISVYVSGYIGTAMQNCWIKLNGETVQNGFGTYSFTTNAETVTIKFSIESLMENVSGKIYMRRYCTAEITTE